MQTLRAKLTCNFSLNKPLTQGGAEYRLKGRHLILTLYVIQ